MEKVRCIIFRRLSDNDFFHINKPPGTERGGGGQSYIDIPSKGVNEKCWKFFFDKIPPFGRTSYGFEWTFTINSLGVGKKQRITIGQRRKNTFNIRSQKLQSKEGNRVYAWDPKLTGFPIPKDSSKKEHIKGLIIFLISLENGDYWAGWILKDKNSNKLPMNADLKRIFSEESGFIKNKGDIFFDSQSPEWAFNIYNSFRIEKENEIDDKFFEEDNIDKRATPKEREEIRKIKMRNIKIANKLKEIYGGKCQISGDKLAFKKKDGTFYSEAHHLIPLGNGGYDSISNLVIVSPLIHKMLHYANVSPIDLKKIKNDKLEIIINGRKFVITWHPKHAKIIEK